MRRSAIGFITVTLCLLMLVANSLATEKEVPSGTREGLNDWKRTGYGGPCPSIGRHRYFHKLYALDVVLPDLGKPTAAALENGMPGHILAQAQLIGIYQRN